MVSRATERHFQCERGKREDQVQVLYVVGRGGFSEEMAFAGGRTLEEMAGGTACAKALRQAAFVLEEQQRGQHTCRGVRDAEIYTR